MGTTPGPPGPGEWWLVKRAGFAGLDVGMTADVTGVRLPGPAGPEPAAVAPGAPAVGAAPAEPRKLDIGGRLLLATGIAGTASDPAPGGGWVGACPGGAGTPGDMAP